MCYIRPRFYAHISIHAPARGATVFARDIFKDSEFQSTLPRGERLSLCSSADIHVSFQSTLPRGERRAGMNTAPGCRIFQSTLPRGERRASAARTPKRKTISIHAPARGATKDLLRKVNLPEISIHAPARGATSSGHCRIICTTNFNPRSREGSDGKVMVMVWDSFGFQSTLPRGERPQWTDFFLRSGNFNPRSREGSDGRCLASQQHCKNFNPRSREGSDAASSNKEKRYQISIHAPARGATIKRDTGSSARSNFNPRSREGSDAAETGKENQGQISIHAPARGATRPMV